MKGNMNNMMKQMQKMQRKMIKAQDELLEMDIPSVCWRRYGDGNCKWEKGNNRCRN